MTAKVYGRTFQKAADLSGGVRELARLLRVPASEIERWIAGAAVPPLPIFLKAIDFVLDETQPPGGLSDPPDSGSPRDCADPSSLNY